MDNRIMFFGSAVVIGVTFLAGSANACGWNYPCDGHVYRTDTDHPSRPNNGPGFGDQGGAAAEVYGNATTGVMKAYGVPAPLANAAGQYNRRNAEIGLREKTPAGAVLGAQYSISFDAIKENGWRGEAVALLTSLSAAKGNLYIGSA